MRKRLEEFVAQAKKAGIQRLDESGTSPDDYQRSVEQQLRVSVDGNLAFGKPVTLLTPHSEKYPVGGATALTDGIHGPNDYHCNWLGFEAEHLDAVIDLGKETSFSSVSTGFLQMWYAWIWLPLQVDVAVSSNGKEFTTVSSITNTVPDTTAGIVHETIHCRRGQAESPLCQGLSAFTPAVPRLAHRRRPEELDLHRRNRSSVRFRKCTVHRLRPQDRLLTMNKLVLFFLCLLLA